MEKQKHTIHVCHECSNAHAIHASLTERLSHDYKVAYTKCMGQCEKQCNIAITAPKKMSCLFTDITPQNLNELDVVFQEYLSHKTGHLDFLNLSLDNQKRYAARLPQA